MKFVDSYISLIDRVEGKMRELPGVLVPKKTREERFELPFELIRTNLLHIFGIRSAEENRSLAISALTEYVINRDIDHTPDYVFPLVDYTRLHDPGDVLGRVFSGDSFLFVGFHTGPYWSMIPFLIKGGANISILFPPALKEKRAEIQLLVNSCIDIFRSKSSVKFLDINNRNFLITAREDLSAGRQLIVYIDGYGGYVANGNVKRDAVFHFFRSEVTTKTTIVRLANILGAPIVTFNAMRSEKPFREVFIDYPLNVGSLVSQEGYSHAGITEMLYQRLATRLALAPAQWEGWLYFNAFFSQRYLTHLTRLSETSGEASDEFDDRYFIQCKDGVKLLVDRNTCKVYRLTDRITEGRTEVAL